MPHDGYPPGPIEPLDKESTAGRQRPAWNSTRYLHVESSRLRRDRCEIGIIPASLWRATPLPRTTSGRPRTCSNCVLWLVSPWVTTNPLIGMSLPFLPTVSGTGEHCSRSIAQETTTPRNCECWKRAQTGSSSLDLRFLLGYHYLMQGHRDAARRQLETVLSVDGRNLAARNLLAFAQHAPQPRREPAAAPSSAGTPSGSAPSATLGNSSSPEIDLGKPGSLNSPTSPVPKP